MLCVEDGSKIGQVIDLVLLLFFNEAINQLAMASSVHWYGHVLRREDDHVLRRGVMCSGGRMVIC